MKLKFNLQRFADEAIEEVSTGVEESEVADPTETEVESTETEETEVEETEEEPKVDVNAIAAAARRKAEQEAKEAQKRLDAEYARRFGNYKNPITGEPIRSQAEYLAALDAQEQLKAEKSLRDQGIDPSVINNLVQNNPVVQKANEYLKIAEQKEAMAEINANVAEISKLDPSIKELKDVPEDVIQMAMDRGYSLVDAYKILNYGKTTSQKAEAIRQSAINQIKGKSHLNPMNGIAVNDNSVDIPTNLRGMWEEAFPDKTWEERKKLYNESLK